MIKSSSGTLCPPGKRHFLESMVGARWNLSSSLDNGDGCLQQLFLNPIISLGRDHEWPPRSPDLTPLDFFV